MLNAACVDKKTSNTGLKISSHFWGINHRFWSYKDPDYYLTVIQQRAVRNICSVFLKKRKIGDSDNGLQTVTEGYDEELFDYTTQIMTHGTLCLCAVPLN